MGILACVFDRYIIPVSVNKYVISEPYVEYDTYVYNLHNVSSRTSPLVNDVIDGRVLVLFCCRYFYFMNDVYFIWNIYTYNIYCYFSPIVISKESSNPDDFLFI